MRPTILNDPSYHRHPGSTVALALLRLADPDDGTIRASTRDLAAACDVPRSTVRRVIARAIDAGHLVSLEGGALALRASSCAKTGQSFGWATGPLFRWATGPLPENENANDVGHMHDAEGGPLARFSGGPPARQIGQFFAGLDECTDDSHELARGRACAGADARDSLSGQFYELTTSVLSGAEGALPAYVAHSRARHRAESDVSRLAVPDADRPPRASVDVGLSGPLGGTGGHRGTQDPDPWDPSSTPPADPSTVPLPPDWDPDPPTVAIEPFALTSPGPVGRAPRRRRQDPAPAHADSGHGKAPRSAPDPTPYVDPYGDPSERHGDAWAGPDATMRASGSDVVAAYEAEWVRRTGRPCGALASMTLGRRYRLELEIDDLLSPTDTRYTVRSAVAAWYDDRYTETRRWPLGLLAPSLGRHLARARTSAIGAPVPGVSGVVDGDDVPV